MEFQIFTLGVLTDWWLFFLEDKGLGGLNPLLPPMGPWVGVGSASWLQFPPKNSKSVQMLGLGGRQVDTLDRQLLQCFTKAIS